MNIPAIRSLTAEELAIEIDRIRDARMQDEAHEAFIKESLRAQKEDSTRLAAAEAYSRMQLKRAVFESDRVAILAAQGSDPDEKAEQLRDIYLRLRAIEQAMDVIAK